MVLFERVGIGMEARREKMIQAKASFQQQGSLKLISSESRMGEVSGAKIKNRNIFLILRWCMAVILLLLYIYGMEWDTGEIGEICRKSMKEIQKNEKYIEKCSAFLGEMW